MESRSVRISFKIHQAFPSLLLSLEDESARHQGHAFAPLEGESHFKLVFHSLPEGYTRLQFHRFLYKLLEKEFSQGLHALSIQVKQGA